MKIVSKRVKFLLIEFLNNFVLKYFYIHISWVFQVIQLIAINFKLQFSRASKIHIERYIIITHRSFHESSLASKQLKQQLNFELALPAL